MSSNDRVVIATLIRPRGIKGELIAIPLSSHPERYQELTKVFCGTRELEVERVWWHGAQLIFKFAGVNSIDDAEKLRSIDVEIPQDQRVALPADEFFLADLIGCQVFDGGRLLGEVSGWQELPGQILLDVGRLEIPFAMRTAIDMNARRIDFELPAGFEEMNG